VGEIIAMGEGVKDYGIGDRVLSLGQHATHVIASTQPHCIARVPIAFPLTMQLLGAGKYLYARCPQGKN